MKFSGRGQLNSQSTRKPWAVLFVLILVGTVFVSMVGNVSATVFDPSHSDDGEDTDSDGDFNYLVVDVVVNVDTPGNYYILGSLEDSGFTVIDTASNFTFLDVGIQVVQLRFEGWLIRANGVNGPYTVDLTLFDDVWNLTDIDSYSTGNYNYNVFELPPAKFILPHSDYGLDTDSDGNFDYLVVNVTVNVSVAGTYRVSGYLNDSIPNPIDSDFNLTFLDAGDQVVQLYFDGMSIYRNGENSPYTVDLHLYDDSSNWMDSDTYIINGYTFGQFQVPGAAFEPPHSDYGLDTDSDGKFNYLVVNVTINVSVAGFYQLDGDLLYGSSNWIDSDSNYTFLPVGIQIVELRFEGWKIYVEGETGQYTVELDLYNDSLIWLYSDVHTTNPYTYDEFQLPPALFKSPHSDYGLDTDSDSLFNYLVVNVTINVSAAGDYSVKGELFDIFFKSIENVTNFTFLNAGIHVVQLYFAGSAIYNNGVDCAFLISLDLFDGLSNLLDTDTHITGPYTFNQFQPLAPPTPPTPPTGLQASLVAGGSDVMLSWNASLDDGVGEDDVEGYTVYRSITGVNGTYEFAA
jgi:hypothetical protein